MDLFRNKGIFYLQRNNQKILEVAELIETHLKGIFEQNSQKAFGNLYVLLSGISYINLRNS